MVERSDTTTGRGMKTPEGCHQWDTVRVMIVTMLQSRWDRIVGASMIQIRGCRSFLAQPPAKRWHPFGMAARRGGEHLKKMGVLTNRGYFVNNDLHY